jgi:oligopeptide transport system permease protein
VRFGLDLPLWRRFTRYLLLDIRPGAGGTQPQIICGVICGNFGPTYTSRGARTVQDELFGSRGGRPSRFAYSARLGLQAMIVALLIGIPAGLLAALRQNSWLDQLVTLLATLGFAVPALITGLMAIIVFAVQLRWLTVIPNWDEPVRPWILPTTVIGLSIAAYIARLTRSSVLEVRRADYVTTARAKGLSQRTVALRHILRNALLPVAVVSGPLLAGLITGTILVESIFQVPGLGLIFAQSVGKRDYNLLLGLTLLYTFWLSVGNLLSDLLVAWLDPRVRLS